MVFSWQMAEELATAHMRSIGFLDARRAAPGADGGIDVAAADACAQVKSHEAPVGAPDVQRLRGAAFGAKHALFYSRSGYTAAASLAADRANVALFHFTQTNDVVAVNDCARTLENREVHRGSDDANRAFAVGFGCSLRLQAWQHATRDTTQTLVDAALQWKSLADAEGTISVMSGPEAEPVLALAALVERFNNGGATLMAETMTALMDLSHRLLPEVTAISEANRDVDTPELRHLVTDVLAAVADVEGALNGVRESMLAEMPSLVDAVTALLDQKRASMDPDALSQLDRYSIDVVA